MSHDPAQEQARLTLLTEAELEIEGVLTEASNLTVRTWLGEAAGPAERPRAVYKPVRGTAPLRDFDARTLAAREVSAYRVSQAGGWHLVPPTVLRDGPLGIGSVQWWIEDSRADAQPGGRLLDVVRRHELPDGWLPVVAAEDEEGRPVVVAHADREDLASLAVLDVVLNNADRKGGHVTLDTEGRMWAFDHGLTLHEQDKLRTVLWGWAGDPLPETDVAHLQVLADRLGEPGEEPGGGLARELTSLLGGAEVEVLVSRVEQLLADGTFPMPPADRYPLPWPVW